MPAFPSLQRFADGCNFDQWTRNDSKALMKVCTIGGQDQLTCSFLQVYLPAIIGHVPTPMVKCLAAFLNFYYIARWNAIDSVALTQLQDALNCFHDHRKIFMETSVRHNMISLPRQHSLQHYRCSIQLFGSPNSLCSSITESKHINAVKDPWHRSSGYKLLYQMLRTNKWMDKMAAMQVIVQHRGMLQGSTSSYTNQLLEGHQPQVQNNEDGGADNNVRPVQGPATLSSVKLAKTSSDAWHFLLYSLGTNNL